MKPKRCQWHKWKTVWGEVRTLGSYLILNLRLTRSWTLYTQIVGRGTRIFIASKHGVPGCLWGDKEDCILLDPLWLCDYHNLIQRPSCLIAVDDQHAEELDALLDAGGDLMEAEKKVQANREDNIRKRLEETAKRKEREISAMELFARCGMMQDVEYQPILREEMGVPTPGQAKALTRYGIDLDTVHSRGQAHKMLDAIGTRVRQGLASPELAKKAQILGMTDAWTRPFWDVNNYIKEMAKYTGLPT